MARDVFEGSGDNLSGGSSGGSGGSGGSSASVYFDDQGFADLSPYTLDGDGSNLIVGADGLRITSGACQFLLMDYPVTEGSSMMVEFDWNGTGSVDLLMKKIVGGPNDANALTVHFDNSNILGYANTTGTPDGNLSGGGNPIGSAGGSGRRWVVGRYSAEAFTVEAWYSNPVLGGVPIKTTSYQSIAARNVNAIAILGQAAIGYPGLQITGTNANLQAMRFRRLTVNTPDTNVIV